VRGPNVPMCGPSGPGGLQARIRNDLFRCGDLGTPDCLIWGTPHFCLTILSLEVCSLCVHLVPGPTGRIAISEPPSVVSAA
jgi:hypothetical protein